jgi:acyl carrier protein
MTDQEIIALTNRVFEESFEVPPDKLQADKHIFNDLGLDSLDIVDLIVALQKKFGVHIRDDERIRAIRTLGDLHVYLITLKREEAAKPK